jgi:hypothetical protein
MLAWPRRTHPRLRTEVSRVWTAVSRGRHKPAVTRCSAVAQTHLWSIPNRTSCLRSPTWNTRGTHAPCERMKNPPAYAFHTFGGAGHGEIRSELTAGLALPHVIAARVRHACGTLTVTGDRPARTTKPAFSQYGHRPPVMRTTCGMYASGTEITPRTRRYPSANGDFGRRMTWSHVTTSCTFVGVAETAAECDEPPKHDSDNAPTSTMTTSTPRFNRTPGRVRPGQPLGKETAW